MNIGEALPAESAELQQLQVAAPQGRSLVVSTVANVPDFFSRVRCYESSRVFNAYEGDRTPAPLPVPSGQESSGGAASASGTSSRTPHRSRLPQARCRQQPAPRGREPSHRAGRGPLRRADHGGQRPLHAPLKARDSIYTASSACRRWRSPARGT